MEVSNSAPLKARQGACVVGLFDDDDLELDELLDAVKKYPPCVAELNEGNVQAIFNRCLYTLESKNRTEARPFYQRLGYSEEEAVYFDQDILLKNKKAILYLFGQVAAVHTKTETQTIADFMMAYSGNKWTDNRGYLLELLYLGSNRETAILFPFNKEKGDITRITPEVTPTLSPKDPAFPAWWEAHKGEWEEPK